MSEITRENWRALSQFGRVGVYVNDLGTDADARVREVYGADKFQRLVALKTVWDPGNTCSTSTPTSARRPPRTSSTVRVGSARRSRPPRVRPRRRRGRRFRRRHSRRWD